jgi:hypothetical protein
MGFIVIILWPWWGLYTVSSLVPVVGVGGRGVWGSLFGTGTGKVRHVVEQWEVGVHHAGYIYIFGRTRTVYLQFWSSSSYVIVSHFMVSYFWPSGPGPGPPPSVPCGSRLFRPFHPSMSGKGQRPLGWSAAWQMLHLKGAITVTPGSCVWRA